MNRKIVESLKKITPVNSEIMKKARSKLDNLTKPRGSLGKLEDFATRMVGITETLTPIINKKVIFVMAADHGVTVEGISAYPQEVTFQMVNNFINKGAGINVLAEHVKADVVVVDMGVVGEFSTNKGIVNKKINHGTRNMAIGPAMNRKEAENSIVFGIEAFEEVWEKEKIDIIGLGEMGIGNTTASSAIVASVTQSEVEKVTGLGTGINEEQFKHKIKIIEKALKINHPDYKDGLDILTKVGGFEIGGLVGCILAAASHRVPIVIDGFISAASTLIALNLSPRVSDYIFVSHQSVEKGHAVALSYIGKTPMFDLKMRLGEGTGAALGIGFIEAAVKVLTQMATFSDANIIKKHVIT